MKTAKAIALSLVILAAIVTFLALPSSAYAATRTPPPPPPPTLAVNESTAVVVMDGKEMTCTSTDYGGRYETICTPRD